MIARFYRRHAIDGITDGQKERKTTERAIATWNREPLFHLSSPKGGWDSTRPQFHADEIDPGDFPASWKRLTTAITVEIEAKRKEVAIARLRTDLAGTASFRAS